MNKRYTARRRYAPKVKGYSEAGASETRRALKGFLARSGSPNEDINWNNYTLRQRGRMLYMASPIATSAINTNRTKVIGTGLTLKSSIDREILGLSPEAAKSWQRITEAEFALWSSKKENCDATGTNNFEGLQQLALKAWLMSGDVFSLFKRYNATITNPYSLRIHLIEADRVSTPMDYGSIVTPSPRFTDGVNFETGNKIFDGVEVDSNGMIVAYHVRNTYPNQITVENAEWIRIEAYGKKTGLPNILQIMDSERPDQYRGVTYLAQVIEPLLQLRRYTESELMAALIQSFFTAWVTTKTDPTEIPMNETGTGDIVGIPGDQPDSISESENEHEMGPGTVLHLEDGEEVTFGNPNIPTTGFDSFVKTVCRLVGAALELPYDVLIKEYNSSYSASRAALLEAWEAFKMRRKWFVDDFCQPIYEVWLAEAVARGRIKAPGFFDDPRIRAAWCGSRWIGPVQGQLDPSKEVKAAIMNVDRGFKTHEQITRELGGGDWEDNVEQLKLENEKLKEAGGGTYMAKLNSNGEETEGSETGE
ncbi:MAG: phage portal protein [Vallitaleaceae bacterium]|nr:phage portal protein [Vallitaleaceae bacterium]